MAFFRRLGHHAGAVLDGAVGKIIGASVSRSGPRRRPRHALRLVEHLATIYGTDALIDEPARFFRPTEPARVTALHAGELPGGGAILDLSFRSPYEPFLASYREELERFPENLTAHARWFRARSPRPVLVCIHGFAGGSFALEERFFGVRKFLEQGLDVVLFQLPFHGRRRPGGGPLTTWFPSPHLVRTNETFGQAIADLRALIAWLRARDAPAVSVLGMSLGGYVTALLATLDPTLDAAIPMIPLTDMPRLMWTLGEGTDALDRARRGGVTQAHVERVFRVHSPLARPPVVPHDRRFVIAGSGDQITPRAQAEALWEHWDRPAIHWFPGGHLLHFGRGPALREVCAFATRVAAPGDSLRPR